MKDKSRINAIMQALLVTFLWSSSIVIIKYGLTSLPAVTFAGLRYSLAGILLWIYVIIYRNKIITTKITKSQWIKLIALGFFLYFLAQGAMYLGLFYLPAVQVSLFLNFTPLLVMVIAFSFLNEKPTRNNLFGVVVFLIGVVIYFIPLNSSGSQFIGYIIMVFGMIGNAVGTVLGRNINKSRQLNPALLAAISMSIGGVLLLITGFVTEPFPSLDFTSVGIIIFLALINTAFAFTLWNHTMRVLNSVESSIINNTMLIQIAILSWIFMNESLSLKEIVGILIAAIGAFFVQYRRTDKHKMDIK